MKNAVKNAEIGDTITLDGDIKLNETLIVDTKGVTIDGNKNAINGKKRIRLSADDVTLENLATSTSVIRLGDGDNPGRDFDNIKVLNNVIRATTASNSYKGLAIYSDVRVNGKISNNTITRSNKAIGANTSKDLRIITNDVGFGGIELFPKGDIPAGTATEINNDKDQSDFHPCKLNQYIVNNNIFARKSND